MNKIKFLMIKMFNFYLLLLISPIFSSEIQYRDMQRYVAAYPDTIERIEDNYLIWKNGSRMPMQKHLPCCDLKESLKNPDLYRQLSIPYKTNNECGAFIPLENEDPGRIRDTEFFDIMYGRSKEEIEQNLVMIDWMPLTFGENTKKLAITQINNVDKKLQSISSDLDRLVLNNPDFKPFLSNPGGTFCYRTIAGTDRRSCHSYGMTIDINVEHSHYWLWDYNKKNKNTDPRSAVLEEDIPSDLIPTYTNNIPIEIVSIFETYGFIWGGKWYHYDTMHFEYRPELLTKLEENNEDM
ncbi:MAG: hypothetical protein C0432_01520 [Candidatus Puniceispirillum sp.]|nr:hypothetical protein [Candidatus Pelagibacter sp.]MBA4282959.1 hypothetical protein [Candidatus Puniceispirillum sp.]